MLSLLSAVLLPQSAVAAPNPFEGRWSVVLVCPDTSDKTGLVKGYEYAFTVSIREGVVQGEYGASGKPSSLVFSGKVSDQGALEITATGNTGQSDYAVGKVAQGTRYSYTMHGKLDGAGGQATRRELRPCTARLTKL